MEFEKVEEAMWSWGSMTTEDIRWSLGVEVKWR
jgi:hypothetical protein